MRAMILAAGRGERLRPLTETIPKPMIPVSSEPLMVHQLKWLKRAGIKNIVVNLHHLGNQIESHIGNGRQYGVQVDYSHESELLDTGGGIVNALPLLGTDPFVVLNGDVWTRFRFQRLAARTTECAHLILAPKPETHEYGDFRLVEGLVDRPPDPADRTHVFCGISLLNPNLFDGCPTGVFSLTRNLLFDRIHEKKVTGEIFDGLWIDVGSHAGLKEVRRIMT